MILDVRITEKSFGNKKLVENIKFSIDEGEKVGLIGRNGIGKSTLLSIILGRDKDFSGEIIFRKNTVLASTRQEYSDIGDETVMEFILSDLPEYANLHKIITELPLTMGDDMRKIERYTDALARFQEKNFHFIEEKIISSLNDFGLSGFENRQLKSLSGGQKRLIDTIKVIYSDANLALVDEPTNFMDFYAKKRFLEWMKGSKEAILVITHDRDVLSEVDKIIEIRDGKSYIFKGNYDDYLRTNTFSTTNQIQDFESTQRRISNLKDKVKEYQRMKEKARDPDTIRRFKRLEIISREELEELEQIKKPSFWIDKNNADNLNFKIAKSYEKFKARNIKISADVKSEKSQRSLISVKNLALGYGSLDDALENKNGAKILFEDMNFDLRVGEKIELRGRNGAGKSSLIKAILFGEKDNLYIYDGEIVKDKSAKIGVYEQEISSDFFEMPLKDAIEKIYLSQNLPISETQIRRILHQYLFNSEDFNIPINKLSGGQKARFQIIKMLSSSPQVLILDEPTSHLDLPSIEELETALEKFNGAILYVSHDDYFRNKIGGEIIEI